MNAVVQHWIHGDRASKITLPCRVLEQPSEITLKAIEHHLLHFHRSRMIELIVHIENLIRVEEANSQPDVQRLAELA